MGCRTPGLTPTAAAMRLAEQRMQTLGPGARSQSVKIGIASNIDHETGLPELIAAGSQVYCVLVELLTNDTTPEGNKYYAATPEQSRRLFAAHEALTVALGIAREGRK